MNAYDLFLKYENLMIYNKILEKEKSRFFLKKKYISDIENTIKQKENELKKIFIKGML